MVECNKISRCSNVFMVRQQQISGIASRRTLGLNGLRSFTKAAEPKSHVGESLV